MNTTDNCDYVLDRDLCFYFIQLISDYSEVSKQTVIVHWPIPNLKTSVSKSHKF